MVKLYEQDEAEKEKILDSKDTNYQKETPKERKSDENNENDAVRLSLTYTSRTLNCCTI